MDLQDVSCVLLNAHTGADALLPADGTLAEVAALVAGCDEPLDWTDALAAALGPGVDDACRRERLAAVQMYAMIGGATGARLLAALWTLPDPGALSSLADGEPGLEAIGSLLAARGARALALPPLAAGTRRVLSVADQLRTVGLRDDSLDLLAAADIVLRHFEDGRVLVAINPSLAALLRHLLAAPRPFSAGFDGSLEGVTVLPDVLVIDIDDGGRVFPNGFPVLVEGEPVAFGTAPGVVGDGDGRANNQDRMAMRKLVLDSIMSTSVLLEFLRDPKISSIPGLVAEVVNRTRNPQVIEVVISNRALHTGFANKAVPLACLRSPVNVPLKSLRKFVHVKYVSRVDLKRLANDRTGIRREVGQEIIRYLESLT